MAQENTYHLLILKQKICKALPEDSRFNLAIVDTEFENNCVAHHGLLNQPISKNIYLFSEIPAYLLCEHPRILTVLFTKNCKCCHKMTNKL